MQASHSSETHSTIENVGSGGGPFAAVIVRAGQIIAEGVNCVTSTNDPTAHAEIVAIRAWEISPTKIPY
jgi:tRNA(Arg) A34 adenosine deaminase TadA